MIFYQTRRKIADLVDLEWFLNRSEEQEFSDSEKNSLLLPGVKIPSDLSDAECLDLWLKAKRKMHLAQGLFLPGKKVLSGLNILFLLTIIISFAIGSGISLGILHYDGSVPVNLLYAFAVLVFLPFATVFVTLLVMLFYRKRLPLAHSLVLHGTRKLLFSMLGKMDSKVSSEKREDALILKREMTEFSRKYAPLVRALLFFTFQLGGFFLVAGMVVAFLVKVAGSDLAFAWQSTLNLKPDELARFLGILGAPWKSFLPEAVPTLAQIEGSRVFLKEGIAGLEGAKLAAWWGFMVMALLVYGLFPRFLLFLFAGFRLRKKASASIPNDSRTKALCFFLKRSSFGGEKKESYWEREIVSEKDEIPGEGEGFSFSGPWELWISEEIPEEEKKNLEGKSFEWMGSKPEQVLFIDLGKLPLSQDSLPLVLCLEVFMPPVLEDLQVLRSIAEKRKNPFWIWPVGRADAHPPYEPSSEDLLIWGKKLQSIPEPKPILMRRPGHGR